MPLLRRKPSVRPWIRPQPVLRAVASFRFPYDIGTEQYIYAPAGPYDADSVWDTDTSAGNVTIAPKVWSPSGLALTFDADGIPYIGGAYTDRQTFDYREWNVATSTLVAVDGGGTTATYMIANEDPELGTVDDQVWVSGVDSAYDLPISDPEDALADLTITGTISGEAITGTYNSRGVRVVLHTYLPGDPAEYQRWRLEFSLTPGGGSASGTISNLTVSDPYDGEATFAAFDWARAEGVQVPSTASGTLSYEDYADLLTAAGLVPSLPIVEINGGITAGNVVSTSPAYPSYIASGSQVFITASGVTVPNVVGLTEAQASAALTAAGLVAVPNYGGTGAAGYVSGQGVAASSLALPGTSVTIFVSVVAFPETVPYLIGATEDSARQMVRAIYCNVSVSGSGGTVVSQSAVAFSSVSRGTTITITMGGDISSHDRRRRGRPPFNSVETVNVRNRLA